MRMEITSQKGKIKYKPIGFMREGAGTSMEPTINSGNIVLSVEVDNMAELKVGDIISFKHPNLADLDNITHRIVRAEVVDGKYRFRTKGDNAPEADPYTVPEENVHDLVIGVIYKTPISKEFDRSIEFTIKSAMELIEANAPTAGRFVLESMPDGTFECHSENLNPIALLGMLDCMVHKLREELRAEVAEKKEG